MSKIKTLGDTLPKNAPTTTSKPDFTKDVKNVNFTLPVKIDGSPIVIHFNDSSDKIVGEYCFDFIPNVDVNQYLQFSVHLYNNGSTFNSPKSR